MRRSAAALLGVALLVAGCGGGGGGRLSRDAYVTKADAICRAADAQRRKLRAPTTVAGIPAYVDRALPLLDAALKRLRSLRPPSEMEQSVNAWLKTNDETRKVLEDLRRAAQAGDAQKVREAGAKGTEVTRRSASLARSLGLTACT